MAQVSGQLNPTVLSYHDCLLRKSDVALLKGPHWLNDNIIGFYFEYLDKQLNSGDRKDLLFIGPEVTQLLKMVDEDSQFNIFLGPIRATESSFVFFPLNDCSKNIESHGSHWSLVVFSKMEGTFYHFDSLQGYNSDTAVDFANGIMSYFFPEGGGKFREIVCPQQKNGYDCGIHVLCLTDIISQYVIQNNRVDGCDFSQTDKLVDMKRVQLLELINKLTIK